jgi:hypothetical protein
MPAPRIRQPGRTMTRTRTTILTVWAVFLPLGSLSAQQPPSLKPGQRIRVTAAAEGLTKDLATLLALSRDTIVIGRPHHHWHGGTDTVRAAMPLGDLQDLEVSIGRRSYWTQGLIIGGIGGGVAGVLYGAIHGIDVDGTNAYCVSQGWASGTHCTRLIAPGLKASIRAGLVGTALGALAGLAIGSGFHRERWVKVPLDRLQVAVVPQSSGGLDLGASLAF